ncbi:MAG TPA: TonB-dependent receptor [Burkholderiales bacterium]|nr:TonB-dependent receptor [Burkholderiales bacterium]
MRTNARRLVVVSVSIAASAALLAALVTPASAQQSIERVEITGSALKRIDAETALPVQIITREEIEKTGAANVEQFLQAVGVAIQGNSNSVVATASGSVTGGVSGVSLRGLGSQRTLVLIDGKRVAGGGTLTDSVTVDVNHIPASAIERIEVLKDGASAIYGSDAIGGVINFILRKDYRGGEVTAHAELTQHPGAKGGGLNALLGWGDMATQRFSATLIADFRHEDALFGRQRSFASTGIFPQYFNDTSSGNTFPANFVAADGSFGTRNPSFPNCPGPYAVRSPLFSDPPPAGLGSRGCRFDPAPLVTLIPKTDQESIFGTVRFGLTREIEGYGQFSYSHKEQRTVIQPVPLSDQFALPPNHVLFNVAPFNGSSTFLLRPSSPYYPDAATQARLGFVGTPDLLVRYRSEITGNRDITNLSDQLRGVLGVKGTLSGWDYDAALLHIDTNLTERVNGGYPLLTKILPLLDSGQVNPFGPNTAATHAAADAAQFRGDAYKTKTSIDGVQAKVTHDLMQLAGGPLALALGAEGRKEGFQLKPSTEIVTGDISGYGGNFLPVDKTRNVGAGFAEVNVPIVRTLEVTGAARYDHYEGVGERTSPKLGARWTPTRQVLLRGSIGKGFRAPSLTELYQPRTIGVTSNGLNDPLRCGKPDGLGGTNASSNDCATQFPITLGGEPALKPEISTNRTLGVVLEPTNNISVGIDYWEVDLKNTIIFGVTPAAILADPAKFGSLITRGPAGTGAPCAGCPGPILDINQINTNFGETRVRGVDLDARYRIPAAAAGTFTIGMNGTYIHKFKVQNPDGSFSSINGMVNPIVNGAGGVIPRWRHYLFLDWKRAPWNFTLAQQYQSGYKDLLGTFDDTDPTSPTFTGVNGAHPRVSSYQLFHVYGSYTGLANNKNLKLTFGIRNLFDKDPPYTNAGGQNYFQSGYDPGYADPRGRTFILSATYKFM